MKSEEQSTTTSTPPTQSYQPTQWASGGMYFISVFLVHLLTKKNLAMAIDPVLQQQSQTAQMYILKKTSFHFIDISLCI